MIKHIHIFDKKMAEKVLFLQKRAYREEAELIGSVNIPPLKENLRELMACGEAFIVFFAEDELLGAISYKLTEEHLDIHRVMVDPDHFRKGIAMNLLLFLQKEDGFGREMIVSTAAENRPALLLYEKLGFMKITEERMEDGMKLVKFRRFS